MEGEAEVGMSIIRTTAKKLPIDLRQRFKTAPDAVMRGIALGTHRGRSIIVPRTPRDRGQAAAAWKVVRIPGGWGLINEAPHVGILELGARPHPVSREGILSLAGWVQRNLGLYGAEALSVAYAIAQKIKKYGQKPTYFVRESIDDLRKALGDEVHRQIVKHATSRRPK